MCEGNQGQIDFGSSEREVPVSEGRVIGRQLYFACHAFLGSSGDLTTHKVLRNGETNVYVRRFPVMFRVNSL